ncbi:MAG TPA: 2-C-methyl-D-erythritol 4-phosphate cytidylyltransferase [Tenuifilaceae bacterium]|nr:2-C-methyl-D-erythritol 4-phosphate cytidylyltransferase [Tenuifilaceae bacterium]
MQTKRYAIIVAGGSGVRMGLDIPKQFIELNGKPILMWTIDVFNGLVNRPEIIVVLPEAQVEQWLELCKKHSYKINHKVTIGGKERFFSVKNGLNLVDDGNSIVAIHDGVRPLVNPSVIEECYITAEKLGNAIPVIQPVESIRIVENDNSSTFPRNNVLLVQTPQVFKTSLIKRCYEQPFNASFTDDASVIEAMGEKVFTVNGNRENIKITNQTDLLMASALINNRSI